MGVSIFDNAVNFLIHYLSHVMITEDNRKMWWRHFFEERRSEIKHVPRLCNVWLNGGFVCTDGDETRKLE